MKVINTLLFAGAMMCATSGFAEEELSWLIPKPLAMGVKYESYRDAAIEGSDVDLSMDYTHIKLPLGKFDIGDNAFVPTLSFEHTDFDVKGDSGASNDPQLYTAKAQFMFIKKLNDKWMRIFQVTPSWHTDGKAKDEDAYSLMGLAIWKYDSTADSSWMMGFGANRLFGE